jgi:Fe-Mn family superoxide dismutase
MGTALAAGSQVLTFGVRPGFSQTKGSFSLPPLPYAEDALAPVISGKTISLHYGKHHKAYVDNLNKAVEGTDLKDSSLEDVVKVALGDHRRAAIYNNAAQAWNHAIYWKSMQPNGGGHLPVRSPTVSKIRSATMPSSVKNSPLPDHPVGQRLGLAVRGQGRS